MVHVGIVDAGKVQALNSGVQERAKVRVVREALVDLQRHRIRERMRMRCLEGTDHPAVVWAGLEHDRRARAATHFERERQADVDHPSVLVHEGTRAE